MADVDAMRNLLAHDAHETKPPFWRLQPGAGGAVGRGGWRWGFIKLDE